MIDNNNETMILCVLVLKRTTQIPRLSNIAGAIATATVPMATYDMNLTGISKLSGDSAVHL